MRDRLALWAIRLFARLPLSVNHSIGAAVGFAAYYIPNRLRRVTLINLALCFPAKDIRWRSAMARQSLIETGKSLTEVGLLWQAHDIRPLVTEVIGADVLAQARAQGRGLILAAPHLGCWELCGLYAAGLGPLHSLYRPPNSGAALNEMIRDGRQSTGATLVPTTAAGIKRLLRALDRGEHVGILPDQEPARGFGLFAPFFGIPAYTMGLVARLARRRQTPVIFIYAERLPHGAGYRVHFRPAPDGIGAEELGAAAAALNAGVEALARECPQQYVWSYKRFGKRPPGEVKFYRR